MASYQRIALYVMFDALERDLILFIRRSMQATAETLLTVEEDRRARERITKRERYDLYNLDDPYDLLHGLDLGDKFNLILRHKNELPAADAIYLLSLKPQFDKAVPIRADVMHGRPLTLDDYVCGFAFGNDLSKRSDIWPGLAASLTALQKNPDAIISQAVIVLEEDHSTAVLYNLPKVDYDDTGFVPRPRLEAELKKKILGRHPVITVLGEGGNGKTALTLQTAYRLVYSQDHDFDAIIWVSAKSSELTVKEIKRISEAITTSIDLFESIAEFEPGAEDPISRVKRFLTENKILLIIDNLETILDPRIRKFAEDVPGHSKLVFTSRVPLGGDLAVRVDEFTETEAERFLRRLIDAHSIESLKRLASDTLQRHLKRLNYKPLLIKWFALGVLSGLAPETITRNPELALRFCLENVVDTLNEQTKKVAMAFAIVSGSHSALIIQVLTDLPSTDVEAAIATLLRYALIEDASRNPYERTYSMRAFARSYLSRIEKAQPEFVTSLRARYARIGGTYQAQREVSSVNPYNPSHYTVRSRSEAIAAARLAQAFQKSERGDSDGALKIIDDLRVTAPEYFEVYRTAAVIHLNAGDIPAAQQAYETAIDIDQ
jgi:LuxR family glucitol operon transcriptional activator